LTKALLPFLNGENKQIKALYYILEIYFHHKDEFFFFSIFTPSLFFSFSRLLFLPHDLVANVQDQKEPPSFKEWKQEEGAIYDSMFEMASCGRLTPRYC